MISGGFPDLCVMVLSVNHFIVSHIKCLCRTEWAHASAASAPCPSVSTGACVCGGGTRTFSCLRGFTERFIHSMLSEPAPGGLGAWGAPGGKTLAAWDFERSRDIPGRMSF